MTNHDAEGLDSPDRESRPESRPNESDLPPTTPWPAVQKFSVPDRVDGYVHRPQLLARIDPTQRRVTVLKAPGGFGKTVLLAETFRNLRGAGAVAAWMTVAADDTLQRLDTCLAYAFENAGLPLRDFIERSSAHGGVTSDFTPRTRLLTAAVHAHGAPCVLVLDEMEQLRDKASLGLLNMLIHKAPANFHLAIACREIPTTLEVASAVFNNQAALLTADDLKFSRGDIARFFGTQRLPDSIASLARQTSGWPIALRLIQNQGEHNDLTEVNAATELASNWMESRLFRSLTNADRELLLDAGLFDWIEADLLDEVLGQRGCKRRIEGNPTLTGLFEAVSGRSSAAIRLHPLIREHCVQRRMQETPDRFQRIHCHIADSLKRRGETVAAMRHAAAAGDLHLTGDILESVGAFRLWTSKGFASLQAADALLTPELVEQRPRLAIVRCVVLLLTGQLDQARRLFHGQLAAQDSPSSPQDLAADDLWFELTFVKGLLLVYGSELLDTGSVQSWAEQGKRILAIEGLDPWTRSLFEYGLFLISHSKGEFASALDHARRAQQFLPADNYYHAFIKIHRGQMAMAQGDVGEAVSQFADVQDWVREHYLQDLALNVNVYVSELNLERNRTAGISSTSSMESAFRGIGTSATACLAFVGTILDLKRRREGVEQALSATDEMLDFARSQGLPLVLRYLEAERVSTLLVKGEVGAAEQAWRRGKLPDRSAACLDLVNQTWREMEAFSCIRLRLLIARHDFEAGRELLNDLLGIAAARNLVRTQMRALALGIALERTAGRPSEAERHLLRFLCLYEIADYARPLARDPAQCFPALEELLSGNAGTVARATALRLSTTLEENEAWECNPPKFSPRELEVLRRIGTMSDGDIARALDLTKGGVRYHIAKLFDKLDARDRRSAVSRARRLGLLP